MGRHLSVVLASSPARRDPGTGTRRDRPPHLGSRTAAARSVRRTRTVIVFSNRPHRNELSAALRESLVALIPQLEGKQRFELRVALNAFDIIERETVSAGAAAESERMRLVRSEEHTSELQSLMRNSYAVFCLKKKKTKR